jgi:hypothetical protein
MPIEIKELIIRATVGNNPQETPTDSSMQENLNKLKTEIINEVTEKVIRALQQKNER